MTELTIGQTITLAEDFEPPPGTLMRWPDYGYDWVVEVDGWHRPGSSVARPPRCGVDYGTRLTVVETGTPQPQETLELLKQRFATIARGRARQSSVNMNPVTRVLRRLGAPEVGERRVGMYVHTSDSETLNNLPDGALLVCGDTGRWRNFGLWRYTRGFTPLLGHHRNAPHGAALRVTYLPPGTETAEPFAPAADPEAELVLIAQWKREALRLGDVARGESGWCGDYQEAMMRSGISEFLVRQLPGAVTVGTGLSAGMTLNTTQQESLPYGAIVRWSGTNGFFYFGRSPNATRGTNTVDLHGGAGAARADDRTWSGDYSGSVELVWDGTGVCSVPVENHAMMNAMPVGTIVMDVGMPSTRWVKESLTAWHEQHLPRGGQWVERTYTYESSGFGTHTLRFTYIPVPGVPAPEGVAVGDLVDSPF